MQYDLAWTNTHIMDLNRSNWDKERSDKARGIYHFAPGPDSKVYIKTSDYQDAASRPAHLLKFVGEDRIAYYRSKFGAEIVTTEDPYWPEPVVPDAEGKYRIVDAILMKIADIEGYVDFRHAERKKGEIGFDDVARGFRQETKAEGNYLDPSKYQ